MFFERKKNKFFIFIRFKYISVKKFLLLNFLKKIGRKKIVKERTEFKTLA